MSQYAVLTAVGEDKPGLVDAVSGFLLRSGCNLEDSRMAILGGEFAMIVLVSGEAAAIDKASKGMAEVAREHGLAVQMRPTRSPAEASRPKTVPYVIGAYSMDHPGIVQRVTHFLAERHINIRALETRVSPAAHTGQPLFTLDAQIEMPVGENVAEIRRGLEAIGAEENIDLELKPAP